MKTKLFAAIIIVGFVGLCPPRAAAHCDTMDGPIVTAAKQAIAKNDVTPVLKWVKKEAEPEIRAAFAKSLAVRKQSAEAKELADLYFFEALVRVQRAGEGEPYTGLKPGGTPVEPGIAAADKAIASGKVDDLLKGLSEGEAARVRQQFQRVMETKKRAEETVEAGREYVEAYVQFIHHVGHENEAAGPEIEQTLQKLERQWADAVKRRDVETISRIQSDDFEFIGPTGALWPKDRALDAIKSGRLDITAFELDEFKVRLNGETAVVHYRVTWHGSFGDTDVSGPQRATDVFVRRDGRWQCVASQTTRISQP